MLDLGSFCDLGWNGGCGVWLCRWKGFLFIGLLKEKVEYGGWWQVGMGKI